MVIDECWYDNGDGDDDEYRIGCCYNGDGCCYNGNGCCYNGDFLTSFYFDKY